MRPSLARALEGVKGRLRKPHSLAQGRGIRIKPSGFRRVRHGMELPRLGVCDQAGKGRGFGTWISMS